LSNKGQSDNRTIDIHFQASLRPKISVTPFHLNSNFCWSDCRLSNRPFHKRYHATLPPFLGRQGRDCRLKGSETPLYHLPARSSRAKISPLAENALLTSVSARSVIRLAHQLSRAAIGRWRSRCVRWCRGGGCRVRQTTSRRGRRKRRGAGREWRRCVGVRMSSR